MISTSPSSLILKICENLRNLRIISSLSSHLRNLRIISSLSSHLHNLRIISSFLSLTSHLNSFHPGHLRINLVLLLCGSLFLYGCNRSAPVRSADATAAATLAALHTAAPPAAVIASPVPTLPPSATPIPATRVHAGDQALFLGDWEKALSEFQQAYTAATAEDIRAAALLGIARAQRMARSPYETERSLEKLLAEHPFAAERADAFFMLAERRSEQQRYAEAIDAYTQYLNLKPGLIDAYIHDLRGDAHFNAADYAAAAADFNQAINASSRLDPDNLRMKMARAYALSEDHPAALTIYDDLYTRAASDNTRALIDLRRAEIFTQLGQPDRARDAYLDAVNKFPTSYHAYTALVALVDSGVEIDQLQRGLIDYYAGQYGVAQAAFDRYLQAAPADPGTALYFYGQSRFHLGAHQGAVEKFDALISAHPGHAYWDEAWEQKAYIQWAYLDDYVAAVETLLGFVEAAPDHPRAAEFLFDAALVSERDNRLDDAAKIFERVFREYPKDERAVRALFLKGIAHYRMGDYLNASDAFARSLAIAVTPADKAAAQLWIGKCHQALGDKAAARLAWEKAAEIDPTGYYSERAVDLMYGRPAFEPPVNFDLGYDLERDRRRAEDWLRSTFNLPADVDLSGPGPLAGFGALLRGTELWNLGYPDEARLEFESVREAVADDPAQLYRLANYLHDLGAYRPAIMAARRVLDLAGMSDADTFGAPIYFNHLRFGAYYRDLVLPSAEEYGFNPLFLYSVIRQESLFEGFVRSSAGAHGLMQIIPSTGADIASNLGWPADYAPEDLARPLVNVRLGINYLAAQRDRFDGDLYAALAAYNAGPGNARAWFDLANSDPDLFLEIIRYSETRAYIRGVYELFNIYRLIYERRL